MHYYSSLQFTQISKKFLPDVFFLSQDSIQNSTLNLIIVSLGSPCLW